MSCSWTPLTGQRHYSQPSLTTPPHVSCEDHASLQVHGKGSTDHYLVLPDHYCSCKAFLFDIVGRSEAVYVRTYPSTPPTLLEPHAAPCDASVLCSKH